MPSVGISSVGAVNDSQRRRVLRRPRLLRPVDGAVLGLNRLVSSTIGAASPSANSAYSMTAPYLRSVTMRITLALPAQLFSIDCW